MAQKRCERDCLRDTNPEMAHLFSPFALSYFGFCDFQVI